MSSEWLPPASQVQDRPGWAGPVRRGGPWPEPGHRPVAALAAWRQLRGHHPGPMFTRLFHSRISLHALSGDAIARMLRTRAHAAGLDAGRVTAHSLRAGHAARAARAGVPLARIAAQTRHKDLSVLVNRDIRPLEALSTTSSRDLGL